MRPGSWPSGITDLPWESSRLRLAALTDRESQVFGLLGQGLSNRQIAASLHVGERTVKLHVSNVLRKLLLESRLQAGLAAAEHARVTASVPEAQ